MAVQAVDGKGNPTPYLLMALMLISIGTLFLSGCIDLGESGKVDVIITIEPQREMVERIGGDLVSVNVMVPTGQSPHSYSPLPSQLLDVAVADVYFMVGSGVEFEINHLSTLREQNDDMVVVDCSEGVEILEFGEHHDGEEEGGEADHDHGTEDSHIWLSPGNYRTMAGNVYLVLIEMDPDNEGTYSENYKAYVEELDALITELESMFEPHDGREFLTYHPGWGYFGDDLNLTQMTIEEEGKKPGPQGLAALIDQAREHNITVVYVEPQFDISSAEVIAESIGGEVIEIDPLAPNYIENIRDVAVKIKGGFGS
ncbi:MAG: zinc ABC transporter substrate-binding protein [Thermoplasmata archaeon]|nr:zinc ABC transporter substrate-binding protein [Thermoplasmata archaeon]